MINFFFNLTPVLQALIAGLFTFFITMLGSSVVLFFKSVNRNIMDVFVSLASGIMLSAAYFSLLEPSVSISNEMGQNTSFIVSFGFIIGGVLIYFFNNFFNFIYSSTDSKFSLRRCFLLMTSITLHNIPEGLVIGVCFGAILNGGSTMISAITLTLGIAIQNFPEGAAISIPMRRDGISRFYSFLFGALSAIVEPIFAVIGAILVLKVNVLLPFVLSFSAGAMIYVVILELIPESQSNSKKDLMALFSMIGFIIMMFLELVL